MRYLVNNAPFGLNMKELSTCINSRVEVKEQLISARRIREVLEKGVSEGRVQKVKKVTFKGTENSFRARL